MEIVCINNVRDCFDHKSLFTSGTTYNFVSVDNRYSKLNGFVGYVKRDDEGLKRWLTGLFKSEIFENVEQ